MTTRPSLFRPYINAYDSPRHTTDLNARAVHLLLSGVHPKDVAQECGVNVRTAYRWKKGLRSAELITVDGWTATFARFNYRPPLRISAWERAA